MKAFFQTIQLALTLLFTGFVATLTLLLAFSPYIAFLVLAFAGAKYLLN